MKTMQTLFMLRHPNHSAQSQYFKRLLVLPGYGDMPEITHDKEDAQHYEYIEEAQAILRRLNRGPYAKWEIFEIRASDGAEV